VSRDRFLTEVRHFADFFLGWPNCQPGSEAPPNWQVRRGLPQSEFGNEGFAQVGDARRQQTRNVHLTNSDLFGDLRLGHPLDEPEF
jgi:hypothetical protein